MENQQPVSQAPDNTLPIPESTVPVTVAQKPTVVAPEQQAIVTPAEPSIDLSQPAIAPQTFSTPNDPLPTPDATQPTMTVATTQKDPGHGLGIASLIMSIIGFGLVGIIVGFVAINKSKKAGLKTNSLGMIGVLLGFVSLITSAVIVFVLYSNANNAALSSLDENMISKTNMLHSKLEEYYNENTSYPNIIATGTLPATDISILETADGTSMRMISANNRAEALATTAPTTDNPYIYIAYDCEATACKGYLIKTFISEPTESNPNPYIKEGLSNSL